MKSYKPKNISTFFIYLIPYFVIILITWYISFNSFKQSGMYVTHDGEIHIIRSMHFINELRRGQFPVRFLPELAYSFGYSTFIFNYPFPYYMVAFFQSFGLSVTDSWKFMQIFSTILSLTFFYQWMLCHTNKKSSLTATILFGLMPFRILTLYVTSQIGGYTALIFAPLIALGINKLLSSKNDKFGGAILSIGIAGIIISHLLSVIIFFVPLTAYVVWLLLDKFSWMKLKKLLFWTSLGVGLSAFYFLPFMVEKSWVKLGHKILVDHHDHWPTLKQIIYSPWGYGNSNPGDNDGMSFQIGFSILISWILSVSIIFFQRKKNLIAKIFALTFIFLCFLMLSISEPVWQIFIPLQLIQYPWRILAVIGFTGSWLAGWSINKLKGIKAWIAVIFLIFLSFYNVRNYIRPWPIDWREDKSYIDDLQSFHGAADISWELMPILANEAPIKTPYLVTNATDSAITVVNIFSPENGKVRKIIEIEATKETNVNIAVWELPVWLVKVNGAVVDKEIGENGTIVIPIEKGFNKIELILVKTQVQKASDLITLFSAGILAIIAIRLSKKHDKF